MGAQGFFKSVKTWFCIALLLKIICACISLKFNDPVWFGFWVPISVMAMYWIVGHRVRELYDVKLTVAKYADSVYYLGFLFTVSSIIICLFDIQSIGENLSGMAMRFGAAMVSTGLGMVARTLYIGFKQDQDDAVKSVEERAIIASENLTLMFDDTYQKLLIFRDEVVGATKETLVGAKEQISELSKHSMGAMDTYFANATQRSNEAFNAMLEDARTASDDLLVTIKGLSEKSEKTLERMETDAMTFGKKAEERLEQTLFPDDLFAQKLKPSIDALAATTEGVNAGISTLADDVKTAARAVGTAIRGLNTKSQILEDSLTAVSSIIESQQSLMDTMRGQGDSYLEGINRVQKEFLGTLNDYQKDFQEELKTNRVVVEQVFEKLHVILDKVESNDSLLASFSQDIGQAFQTLSETNIRVNEAFSNSITGALQPLIEAVYQNNVTYQALADRVEQGNKTIGVAHAQLDELAGKIEHISKIESRQNAVNESTLTPGLDVSSAVVAEHPVLDVRPA